MISRRAFLEGAAASLLLPFPAAARQDDTLYNGITLGRPWPPDWRYPDEHPTRPPYLTNRPAVVPIDVGRQLFVDDFLIESTTLRRTFHKAVYHAANPILKPEFDWETYDDVAARTSRPFNPSAMPFSDGVFFDPKDKTFKLWYMAGYGSSTCLALSSDGIAWHKPRFDVMKGTNIVLRQPRDSSTIWLDQFAADPRQRFKMAFWHDHALLLAVSSDGIHWNLIGESGPTGDRSTFFYNPFRRR